MERSRRNRLIKAPPALLDTLPPTDSSCLGMTAPFAFRRTTHLFRFYHQPNRIDQPKNSCPERSAMKRNEVKRNGTKSKEPPNQSSSCTTQMLSPNSP